MSNGDATLRINQCSANSNVLTASIMSTAVSISDLSVTIQVLDGIINPPSVSVDAFKIYIYDSSNKVKDFNDSLQVVFTSGLLKSK